MFRLPPDSNGRVNGRPLRLARSGLAPSSSARSDARRTSAVGGGNHPSCAGHGPLEQAPRRERTIAQGRARADRMKDSGAHRNTLSAAGSLPCSHPGTAASAAVLEVEHELRTRANPDDRPRRRAAGRKSSAGRGTCAGKAQRAGRSGGEGRVEQDVLRALGRDRGGGRTPEWRSASQRATGDARPKRGALHGAWRERSTAQQATLHRFFATTCRRRKCAPLSNGFPQDLHSLLKLRRRGCATQGDAQRCARFVFAAAHREQNV